MLNDLIELASEYEAKARQLRAAAAVLTNGAAVSGEEASIGPDRTPRSESGTFAGVTQNDYMDVIRSRPAGTRWEPQLLAVAMKSLGHDTNSEAARQMLYRLEKKGQVVKVARGVWALPPTNDVVSQLNEPAGMRAEREPPDDLPPALRAVVGR